MKDWQLCRIGRTYSFSAAHRLPKVHENHKCYRLHGHNYVVEIEIRGEIAPKDGFCNNMDFGEVDSHVDPVIKRLDHHYLNDIPGLENPTAEVIAKWIMDELNKEFAIYYSVKVWETPRCWAMVVNKNGLYKPEHRE